MNLILLLSLVFASFTVSSEETKVLEIKFSKDEPKIRIETINLSNGQRFILNEIQNLSDKIDTEARGDKEGNGGHYLVAQFAQELFIKANTLNSELIPYFSSIVQSISIVRAKTFCAAIKEDLILVDESCMEKLSAIHKFDTLIEFILQNLDQFSLVASTVSIKTNLCQSDQSSILDLPYPSDYIRVYLLEFLGSSRYFESHYGIASIEQNFNPVVLTNVNLIDSFGNAVCAKYTRDFTYYNSKCWKKASGAQRLMLVYHEVLRGFKINDDDYIQTLTYLNKASCSQYWNQFRFLDR